jgi:hypothetical protein
MFLKKGEKIPEVWQGVARHSMSRPPTAAWVKKQGLKPNLLVLNNTNILSAGTTPRNTHN